MILIRIDRIIQTVIFIVLTCSSQVQGAVLTGETSFLYLWDMERNLHVRFEAQFLWHVFYASSMFQYNCELKSQFISSLFQYQCFERNETGGK